MKTISDEQLILLYYGEHDDPDLAEQVAKDAELTARMNALVSDLNCLSNSYHPKPLTSSERDDMWTAASSALPKQPGLLTRLLEQINTPRLSFASLAGIVLVAMVAYLAGNQMQPTDAPVQVTQIPQIDGDKVQQLYLNTHLASSEMLLTALGNDEAIEDALWVEEMLARNRLYRIQALRAGNMRLANLLAELEPVLIEMTNSPPGEQPELNGSGGSLLLQIKQMQYQLGQQPQSQRI